MMGAYRKGTDALLDEAIALTPKMVDFLSQEVGSHVDIATAASAMSGLVAGEN